VGCSCREPPSDYNKENDLGAGLAAIDLGVKKWYRVFFEHPIIAACLRANVIRPWEAACLQLTS
jgi:hypothetical protein